MLFTANVDDFEVSVALTVPISVLFIIELAGTFELTPPPVRYLIVRVVLEGAYPYVLVYRTLVGSYATSSLLTW